MRHFITARQQHIIEPNHAKSLQANTILVTGIPDRYLNRRSLLDLFDELPGGVKKIWINRNLKELPEIYSRRLSACNKLESAETALLRTAAKIRQREEKKKSKASKKTVPVSKEHTHTHSEDLETAAIVVPHGQRPTHRLGFLPFTGKKVDTIDWAREEIVTCNRLLEEGCAAIREDDEASSEVQNPGEFSSDASSAKLSTFLLSSSTSICNNLPPVGLKPVAAIKNTTTAIKARFAGYGDSKYPPFNSAFVTFHKQIAAHLAVRVLTHHEPYSMSTYVQFFDMIFFSRHLQQISTTKSALKMSFGLTWIWILMSRRWSFLHEFLFVSKASTLINFRFEWLSVILSQLLWSYFGWFLVSPSQAAERNPSFSYSNNSCVRRCPFQCSQPLQSIQLACLDLRFTACHRWHNFWCSSTSTTRHSHGSSSHCLETPCPVWGDS